MRGPTRNDNAGPFHGKSFLRKVQMLVYNPERIARTKFFEEKTCVSNG
jgi:hypothetical protein